MVNWNGDAVQQGSETGGGSIWSETAVYAGSIDYHAAWRFAGPTPPQGQTLDDATMTVEIDVVSGTDPNLVYRANDVDDAPVINTAGRPSQMTLTTAEVTLPNNAGTGQEVTVITPVVQEIVDRPGWAPGQDMVIVAWEDGADVDYYRFSLTAGDEANLDINWTLAGDDPVTLVTAPMRAA